MGWAFALAPGAPRRSPVVLGSVERRVRGGVSSALGDWAPSAAASFSDRFIYQALSSSGTLGVRLFLLRQKPLDSPISGLFELVPRTGARSPVRNCCMPPANFFPSSELGAET